jgi:uncharacterized protein
MKNVLFIHSAGEQSETAGSGPLVAALRARLGSDYDLHAPTMPSPECPAATPWLRACGEHISRLGGRFVLCGHSLGGSIILKHLAEQGIPQGLAGVVSIAAPFWGAPDWDVPEFVLPENAGTRLRTLNRVALIHSRDDDVVPFEHLQRYAEILPQAVVRPLDGRGHAFTDGRVGDIVTEILRLPGFAANAA